MRHGFEVVSQSVIKRQAGPPLECVLNESPDLGGATTVWGILRSQTGEGQAIVNEVVDRVVLHELGAKTPREIDPDPPHRNARLERVSVLYQANGVAKLNTCGVLLVSSLRAGLNAEAVDNDLW